MALNFRESGTKTRLWFAAAVLAMLAVVASSQEPSVSSSTKNAALVHTHSPNSVPLARAQAELLHKTFAATLDVMHDRYFRNDRDTIPARAMEDIFQDLKREEGIEARWIGVNAKTMGINHEPRDDFEKLAAQTLRKKQDTMEQIEGKLYRRAAAIPLSSGCLTCHGSFGMEPKTPRVAGLVIGIPLQE